MESSHYHMNSNLALQVLTSKPTDPFNLPTQPPLLEVCSSCFLISLANPCVAPYEDNLVNSYTLCTDSGSTWSLVDHSKPDAMVPTPLPAGVDYVGVLDILANHIPCISVLFKGEIGRD